MQSKDNPNEGRPMVIGGLLLMAVVIFFAVHPVPVHLTFDGPGFTVDRNHQSITWHGAFSNTAVLVRKGQLVGRDDCWGRFAIRTYRPASPEEVRIWEQYFSPRPT